MHLQHMESATLKKSQKKKNQLILRCLLPGVFQLLERADQEPSCSGWEWFLHFSLSLSLQKGSSWTNSDIKSVVFFSGKSCLKELFCFISLWCLRSHKRVKRSLEALSQPKWSDHPYTVCEVFFQTQQNSFLKCVEFISLSALISLYTPLLNGDRWF